MNPRARRFDALYAEHYRSVYAFVYRRLAPRTSDVADVTADVFAVAWRRLDDVPGGNSERLWLYGVAHNCVVRAQRGSLRRRRLIGRLAQQARLDEPADDVTGRREQVREGMSRLRPRDREVLQLVMWDGLSHAEAASVLGCSVNAVAQRLHTARERLRKELVGPAPGSAELTTK